MTQLLFILLILGVTQGIAEFLPISSSGHLVILEHVPYIKKSLDTFAKNQNLFINVALHFATLIAIIIYLWKDIIEIIKGLFLGIKEKDLTKKEVKISMYIVFASIPAGIIGILLHDFFERVFSTPKIAFSLLIFNGIILIHTKKISIKDRNIEQIGLARSIFIGFFQAIAILPGISRSGMTIAGGMFSGLAPLEAARFSFLMAIPVIGGAGLLEFVKVLKGNVSTNLIVPLAITMVITIVVALACLKLLFALVKRIKIDIFGYYTIALGIIGLIILL